MIFVEVVMLGFIEMSLFRFFTQSLPRNCPMWGLLRKFNDIRTTQKFASCRM